MCLLIDDDPSDTGGNDSGAAKLQLKRHHTWLVPRRVLTAVLAFSIVFLILGMVLMAIGGGVGSTVLRLIGGIMFGFGIVGLIVCLLVCLYAYFFYGTRDQSVQTDIVWTDDYMGDVPGYASMGRPSALKSAESTLRRNGGAGQKKVTMAPEVGPYAESPPNVTMAGGPIVVGTRSQMKNSPSYGSGSLALGDGRDPRGVGGRTVSTSDVGTGGIRIMPKDRPFPSADNLDRYAGQGQAQSGGGYFVQGQSGGGQLGGGQYVYGAGPGHVIYSGGGSSASSSVIDPTYAYPKSMSAISGAESGYNESVAGSQYSTLRSIPVTHIVPESQRQQQQQQQQLQDSVEYARVNKQAKNAHAHTLNVVPGHSSYSQAGTIQQRFPVTDDFDYDNPVERTPMIPAKQNQSYHEQQMQYQRHRSQQGTPDLYAPRTINTYSLQRQTASPYQYQQLQQQQQQHQQQQDVHYQSTHSTSRMVNKDDLPEPQPLVYPSARRPMTFEQLSSSKMSMYDNVGGQKDSEEE